jgi:undecaprenyl-diphosphatase
VTAGVAITLWLLSVAGTLSLLEGVREHGDLARLDLPTLTWFVGHREPAVTVVMTTVTTIGGEVVMSIVAMLTVLFLVWRRRRVEALLLAVALGGSETVSLIVKHLAGRTRPPAVDVLGPVEHTLSFPSGHTIGTAAFTLGLAYLWWRRRQSRTRAVVGSVVAVVLTVLMATSRLYLGDHWLTDVVASTVLAIGVMAVVVLVDLWLRRRVDG